MEKCYKCYKCGKDAAPGKFIKEHGPGNGPLDMDFKPVCEDCFSGKMVIHHDLPITPESVKPKKIVKKVSVTSHYSLHEMEESINEFIKHRNVLDVKYQPIVINNVAYHASIIFYEEEE